MFHFYPHQSGILFQIGPSVVYLMFNTPFGEGVYTHTLLPIEPLMQKMVHQIYFTWYVPPIIPKFYLLAEALMIERDIMIWNNKQYLRKPMMVKSKEDSLLTKHRRWYSQFYSEHSPRLEFKKETLDWWTFKTEPSIYCYLQKLRDAIRSMA